MVENNLMIKEDLQNAVAEVVKRIQETAAATEIKSDGRVQKNNYE